MLESKSSKSAESKRLGAGGEERRGEERGGGGGGVSQFVGGFDGAGDDDSDFSFRKN